ncbi:hypothetical protein K8R32_01155 [bacterium]|nr:hypothetical protein [bacterium]
MFNIIPLILILISLVIIIIIVTRKFSVLAALDVENIPAEREAKFKERIIGNRLKRNFIKYYSRIVRILKPGGIAIAEAVRSGYKKLIEFKENYNKEEIAKEDSPGLVDKLFVEVEDLIKDGNYNEAEQKLIDIIGIDAKSVKSFRKLGEVYFEKKDYEEAKQTYKHALRLLEKERDSIELSEKEEEGKTEALAGIDSRLAEIYFDVALIDRINNNHVEALNNLGKALKIQPNNPRYLDTKCEISIMEEDKISALDAYEKLKEVNPENQKLADFKHEINEL